ncbi:hypothetical protein B5F41_02780 [Gordonibacter sp. An232A]|nr:hypothetical protein B5F41_02780 [Gordonibacter sp. An232A]
MRAAARVRGRIVLRVRGALAGFCGGRTGGARARGRAVGALPRWGRHLGVGARACGLLAVGRGDGRALTPSVAGASARDRRAGRASSAGFSAFSALLEAAAGDRCRQARRMR